jgi:hypothetical protein
VAAKRVVLVAISLGLILASAASWSAAAAEPSTAGFSYFRSGLTPLVNGRKWILQGTKLADGSCEYKYVNDETVVPPGGWEERSIALDPARCRKLMEEGTPTDLLAASKGGDAGPSDSATAYPTQSGGDVQALASGSQTAYIRVRWLDPINIRVNGDVTQIHWSYNGSTVSGAYANGFWAWNADTGWSMYAHSVTAAYQSGNTSVLGTTTSDFKNLTFCDPFPDVYAHYYYVRMWGHKDGTATWSQSSDSVHECFTFHTDTLSAYGAFPGW